MVHSLKTTAHVPLHTCQPAGLLCWLVCVGRGLTRSMDPSCQTAVVLTKTVLTRRRGHLHRASPPARRHRTNSQGSCRLEARHFMHLLQDNYSERLELNPGKLLHTEPRVLLADMMPSRGAVETVGWVWKRGYGWWCVACSA